MRQPETDLLSEMREQLKFETLLVEISTYFVNLPADRIDDAIKDAQRRICEFLDLDRSALWQFSEKESGKAFLTHIQQLREAPVPDGPLDAKNACAWPQMPRTRVYGTWNLTQIPFGSHPKPVSCLILHGVKS